MTIERPAGQTRTPHPASSHVLFCNCAHYETISRTSREQILHALSQAGVAVEVVPDLCGLAAQRDPRLQAWAQIPSLTIVACFPRAVRWLFHATGVPLPQEQVRLFNMRTQPPDEITRELMMDDGLLMIEEGDCPAVAAANHQSSIINHQSDWVPWFPVIDYDRCHNCKQCLNFCLFGVYGLSAEGRVEVHKPSGCKTNCPACARMCPQQAIIFPKYADSPINGDDSSMGVPPMSSTGDIYARLRSRSAGARRFSTQPDEASLMRSCPMLDNLRRELNVPDDVLASLTPAEMQRIVAQSKQALRSDAREKDDKPHE
jgi:NAD-dependent dihydropyrimidine dehydrogenase PreA subunit